MTAVDGKKKKKKNHVSWYGSLYSDGVLITAIDRELGCER